MTSMMIAITWFWLVVAVLSSIGNLVFTSRGGTEKSPVVNTAELLTASYADHGSIEGRLQVVSERRGLHVVVYEPLWDKPVRCHLSDEQAEVALRNFGKRVEVTGIVRYRGDGMPISIDVEEIEPFPAPEDIPGFQAVRGILRDTP